MIVNMKRSCGVLLPVSALPSPYGIGTFGPAAYRFVDFLKAAGQKYWQMLPLVSTGVGDSPYQSCSTFAGNPYFIDLQLLADDGLLSREECGAVEWGACEDSVDYEKLYQNRFDLLRTAYMRGRGPAGPDYEAFVRKNDFWLGDYALYMALKTHFGGKPWTEWETSIRERQPDAVASYKETLSDEIGFWEFTQYLFYMQYMRLKNYAAGSGVGIIGDMPIYVALDSADVWSNTALFDLEKDLSPAFVAGVPPDYFSKTGQLWGNPVYNWKGHAEELFAWWLTRLTTSFELYDTVRIDHFRAFDEYYAIPFGDKTAENGTWKKGPGIAFFEYMHRHLGNLSIIAEDLGGMTDTVRELLEKTGFPGMKVLQFGLQANDDSLHLPHNYRENMVVYTGTHDNDTLLGWYDSANPDDQRFALKYLHASGREELADGAVRALYASPARLAILPLQDWLGLDSSARINTPSTLGENWKWRFPAGLLTPALAAKMNTLAETYRRSDTWKAGRPVDARQILEDFSARLRNEHHTTPEAADTVTIYNALSSAVMDAIYSRWQNCAENMARQKQACYFSAEFLVGRAVYNNLYCLGIYDRLSAVLQAKGVGLNRLEDIEDAALGNGGLGRLAACLLDSAATHSLPVNGYGIRYRYGLFRQSIVNGFQKETADDWLSQGDPWSVRRESERVKVAFRDQTVWAVPYDVPVIGYGSGYISTIRLWQSEPLEQLDFTLFNEQKYDLAVSPKNRAERITLSLYPNDDTDSGKALRIMQEYFFTSASLQDILRRFKNLHGGSFEAFPDFYAVQLNDTHPVVAIPELIRLLMNEGVQFEKALNIAGRTFAYTNHTVMPEALEKWNLRLFSSVIPEIARIVVRINRRLVSRLRKAGLDDAEIEKLAIVSNKTVHIARLAVYVSHTVNGVSQIHTELIESQLFKKWYELAPEKFQNKTNGITQRRWLGLCNRELSGQITGLIGDGWKTDLSQLKNLLLYRNDKTAIETFSAIKTQKKKQLADFILKRENIVIDERFVFDVQVKRLHEYKRQLLNAFSIVDIYFRLKDGLLRGFTPTVFLFGAKAAPGYYRAKGIIKYINEIASLVNSDPAISDLLKVVFIQNYDVSYAEKIIPAADISEQISPAGTEASGTSNMKLMLNGAVTLGTYDGANIDIFEQAGQENNYVFGARVDELESIRVSYDPRKIYESNAELRRCVDTLIDGTIDDGGTGMFRELYDSLLIGASWHSPDNYFLFYDFDDYMRKKLQANADYAGGFSFAQKCWMNIANAGMFSSDRTISEYAKDIWNIHPVKGGLSL